MTPALRKPNPDNLSPLAKAAALEALETLESPANRDLVVTAARMEPQHIMALLLRTAGKLACSEATPDEIRGAMLMATVWISHAAGDNGSVSH